MAHADEDGDTALHFAAARGHARLIKLLGAHGAPVNAQNIKRLTALHLAVKRQARPTASRPCSGSAPTRRCAKKRVRPRWSWPMRRCMGIDLGQHQSTEKFAATVQGKSAVAQLLRGSCCSAPPGSGWH